LFKPGVVQNLGFTNSLLRDCDYSTLFNSLNNNSLNTIESFKNLSRSFGNFNLAFNNVNNYFNEGTNVSNHVKQEQNVFSTQTVPIKFKSRFGSISANAHNKNNPMKKDFLNRMRRRSIKNNKIVFCHSLAAKKALAEKVKMSNSRKSKKLKTSKQMKLHWIMKRVMKIFKRN
jgi:hypothetical protein